MSLRQVWRLLKETFSEWQSNEVSLLASSLAYYTVFSLAPLMVMIVVILGAIYGETTAKQQIVDQMTEIVGEGGAQLLGTAIANMREDTRGDLFRLIFNFINHLLKLQQHFHVCHFLFTFVVNTKDNRVKRK